jgi:spermidine synthase
MNPVLFLIKRPSMPNTKISASRGIAAKREQRTAEREVPSHDPVRRNAGWLGAMLFLSGAAALVYQVVWVRQLSLVVGVEIYSITVAVSAFFAGLALGGALLGRIADRSKHPFLLYCMLEAGVGLAGVAATIALSHSAGAFVALESHVGLVAWGLPFLLIGAPAFLMGGTLPVAVRWLAAAGSHVARAGGWVYVANTAGGIAGALLSPFVLLPWLGVHGTAIAAALFNLIAAAIAFALNRADAEQTAREKSKGFEQSPSGSHIAFALYALAGGIALGYEVVWSQAMAQFLSTRVFAFSVVLATYLAGLVVGSALYVSFASRLRDKWGIFGLLTAAAGLVALLEIACLGLWQLNIQFLAGKLALWATGSEFARMFMQFLVAAMGVVFVPTVLLGAAFPAVLQLTTGTERTGRDVGLVLALNTAGGIAGTLLTGFLLIPALGLVRTLSMLAIAAATVGILAVLLGSSVSRRLRWAVFGLGAVAVVAGFLAPQNRLSRLLLTTRGGGSLIFYQESRGATVAVSEQRSGDNVFRRLYIQGVSNSGDAMPSLRYMRLQAMLPLLIHRGGPQSALVIGFGTGITAGAVLRYPRLERRVCVELLPAVVQAGKLFPENYGADSDPRVQIRISDGRHELLRSAEHYDLITLEPPPPSAEGVVNLYSRDFYRLANSRLEVNGLFAQWLPIAAQNDEDTRSLVRSFLDVFPYATLWSTELHEMLLVGSQQPIELDMKEITSRFAQTEVSTALRAVGISSPAALLATWVSGRDGLERYAAKASPVTDDHPRIEYAPWVRPGEITRALPQLLALRTGLPPLINADNASPEEIGRERTTLSDFYTAGIAAYNGDRDEWARAMKSVLAADENNPYFLWIAGGRR